MPTLVASSPTALNLTTYSLYLLLLLCILTNKTWQNEVQQKPITVAQLRQQLKGRDQDEWRSLWHVERFRRCRQQLKPHILMACNNDIYKLDKRGDDGGGELSDSLDAAELGSVPGGTNTPPNPSLYAAPYGHYSSKEAPWYGDPDLRYSAHNRVGAQLGGGRAAESGPQREQGVTTVEAGPFISEELAHSFLSGLQAAGGGRGRRRAKRSIMSECCYSDLGCTWEEYAEYCQNHNRIRLKRRR